MTSGLKNLGNDRIVILSAPNGARRSQADHPALPITATELAEAAVELRDAGVAVLHLHVRDDDGKHTLDAGRYREAIDAIRNRVDDDLIIQVTTEAVGMYEPGQQLALVSELKPEAVSLALKEVCPPGTDEQGFAEFCGWMKRSGVWPQYILYSKSDVQRFDDMRQRGVFHDDAPFALFVLGNYADARNGTVDDLDELLSVTDQAAYPWAVCCFGPNEHLVMLETAGKGGHVRIGFENNLAMPDGSTADDNAALIREFVIASGYYERRPATPAEIRSIF